MYQQVHKYNLDCGGGVAHFWVGGVEIVAGESYPAPPSLNKTLVIWDINLGNIRVKVHSGHHWGMKFCPLKRGAHLAQVDLY